MKVAFMSKQCGFPFSISVVYAPSISFRSNETKSNLDRKCFGSGIITILAIREYIKDKRVCMYFGNPFSFSQNLKREEKGSESP